MVACSDGSRLSSKSKGTHMTDLQERDSASQRDRDIAKNRIEKRRNLSGGFVAYLVINAFLVGVWLLTGRGYFWPAWIIAGWGVGMLLGLWDYLRGPVTEADIEREVRRMRGEGLG